MFKKKEILNSQMWLKLQVVQFIVYEYIVNVILNLY